MEHIGYSLLDPSGKEIEFWGDVSGVTCGAPSVIALPDRHIQCPAVGVDYAGYKLVERWIEDGDSDALKVESGKVVLTRKAPEPVKKMPSLKAAAFNLSVKDGSVIGVEGSFNFSKALCEDVGRCRLFFSASEPDSFYFAQVCGGAPYLIVAERLTDSLLIEAKDAVDGKFIDPTEFNIQVFRME